MNSGEKKGDREIMESLIRDQRAAGVGAREAEERARRVMSKVDRQLTQQGKR